MDVPLRLGKPAITVQQPDGATAPATPDTPQKHLMQPRSTASSVFAYQDDQLSNTPENDLDDHLDSIFPELVDYSLKLTFENKVIKVENVKRTVPVNAQTSYDNIKRTAESVVREACAKDLTARELVFRRGSCTIIGDSTVSHQVRALSTQDDWKEIGTLMINWWTSKRHKSIYLDVHLEYFARESSLNGRETFAKIKMNEISKLMKRSFDNRDYIARTDLERVASADTIRRVVDEDPDISTSAKEDLRERIQSQARMLFIMFVNADLGMSCLTKLLDRKLTDSNFFPLENSLLCHSRCLKLFKNLVNEQGGFRAAQFMTVGEHQDLDDRVVVPIEYFPKEESGDDKKDTRKERARCGHGAHSSVFRVRVDQHHHKLSEDRGIAFALKEFKRQERETDFRKELKILARLREYPHEHIVTHLATWTQEDKYYMLFPYAECNLREYMQRQKFGRFSNERVLWLLEQTCGLANAVRLIHNLSKSSAANGSTPTSTLSAPGKVVQESGWHHDLKPENILFFASSNANHSHRTHKMTNGKLSIADLGSGKIHTYRSGSVQTGAQNGTPTYEPPEAKPGGRTSRPYDVWSLGCVFLEVLVWAVFDYKGVQEFSNDRFARRFPDSHYNTVDDDSYWQMDNNGAVTVRKAVGNWIKKLKDEVQKDERSTFMEVIDLVEERMLDPQLATRITALDLWDTLDRIHTQKKIDLKRRDEPESAQELPRLSMNAPRMQVVQNRQRGSSTSGTLHEQQVRYQGDTLMTSPTESHFSHSHRRGSSASEMLSPTSVTSRRRDSSFSSVRGNAGSSIHSTSRALTPEPPSH